MKYTIEEKKLMSKLISNEISFDEFVITSIKNGLFLSKDELIEKLLLKNEIDFFLFYRIISYYKMSISHKRLEFLLSINITTNNYIYLCFENDIELPNKDILKQLFLKNYIGEDIYSKLINKKIVEPISEDELYNYITKYYDGFDILIKSIKYNLVNGIKFALNIGYDIKMYKTLVLGIALSNDIKSFEVIKLLLENGANVNDDVMEIAKINLTEDNNDIMLLLKSKYNN